MSEPLDRSVIDEVLAESLPGWSYEEDALVKTFTLEHFSAALAFIVRMGVECEKMSHHPHLTNVWNKVTIRLNTHDSGNKVTQKDIDLAKVIQHFSWVE
jgi:4a-hydroxytetrahydrobiopterin dehydratase